MAEIVNGLGKIGDAMVAIGYGLAVINDGIVTIGNVAVAIGYDSVTVWGGLVMFGNGLIGNDLVAIVNNGLLNKGLALI